MGKTANVNLLSEWVRLGLSRKKIPTGWYMKYSPWGLTLGMGRECPTITTNSISQEKVADATLDKNAVDG